MMMQMENKFQMVSLTVFCAVVTAANCLQYVEIFRDDFNDDTIQSSKWNRVDIAATVNNELEYYTPEDTFQKNGILSLRSQKRNFKGRQYTSGRVDTKDKFKFMYGEVEWRAKLPKGKGIWPALWLLGNNCPAATPCPSPFWPPEIDVMEARGDITNKVTNALHYGVHPNNAYKGKDVIGPDFTADFHKFKVLWDPDQVVFYVDGKEESKITDKSQIPKTEMYLIMNTAVGGQYSGNPDESTGFPVEFLIDYVTVHRWQ